MTGPHSFGSTVASSSSILIILGALKPRDSRASNAHKIINFGQDVATEEQFSFGYPKSFI